MNSKFRNGSRGNLGRIVKTVGILVLAFAFWRVGLTFAQTAPNLKGQQCPDWVHASYTVVGPDGKTYPTWHPSVDPTYGCWFDHEHGSDPHLFVGFAVSGMPAFGYTGLQTNIDEPHEGFKVYVTNDDLHGHAWLAVLHQGSRGVKRAFTQAHSLQWTFTTTTGAKLADIKTMADFGYASPNCSGPGNETPAKFVALPNSGSGYPFNGNQSQRRFVPTVDCAATRVYETWSPIVKVANNIFMANATFDIDNPSTVVDPNNPNALHYMCEYRNQNENCTTFYDTQWAGNKRNIVSPQIVVNNKGASEFFTDNFGNLVAANTPGAIKQFVATGSWSVTPCFCGGDSFRPQNTGLYKAGADPLGPTAMLNGFPFGPRAAGVQPPPSTPAPGTPVPPTPVVPTPVIPAGPALIVYVTPPNANPGGKVDVLIGVSNVTDLYAMQTQCTVTPGVLVGTARSDGDVFKSANSFFVDRGFNATTGVWTVAASKLKPNPSFTGQGVAYKLSYNVKGAGTSAVNCTVLAVDSKGKTLNLTVVNGTFSGAAAAIIAPTAVPVQPIVAPVIPPTEVPVIPTVVPTSIPAPVSQLSTISGVMTFQNETDSTGITVQLVTSDQVLATVTTAADGSYTFTDVPTGTYGVTAAAPQHLRIGKVVDVTADGQVINMGALELPGGDADNNGTVDLSDASLVGANFDTPAVVPEADLNGDGLIDIQDLALIGGNFGLTGPIVK